MMSGETATEPIAGNGMTISEPDDLATVIAERDDYLEQLQRSRAEFANFRRRIEREREQLREIANHALLVQLLPALDDLQRALMALPADQRDTPFAQGIQLVERKFVSALERVGVTLLEAEGQPFDPALHEAVDFEPGSAGDRVVAVYQPGYRLGSSMLRPAMVKVGSANGRPPAGEDQPASGNDHVHASKGSSASTATAES
jgi:molecular chaperone GrpE